MIDNTEKHLQNLYHDTSARCVLLLSAGGELIDMAGQREGLDISSVCALIAANFMAAAELARLLGNDPVFESCYHEGSSFDIYAADINEHYLLAVIAGPQSRAGIVRFYTNLAVQALTPLLQAETGSAPVGDDFSGGVDVELDRLFRQD